METEKLIELYPRLYHMATAGSWPSIRAKGLWTTEQIVTTAGLSHKDVDLLLHERRPQSVAVNHPQLGNVIIRDQIPLKVGFLEDCLTDMTTVEWLATLNNRVFFWLHEERLNGLLNARHYRTREQDVLTIDTRSLIESHCEKVRLSAMNSGSTLFPNPPMRGSTTFTNIGNFAYEERRRGRALKDTVVELAVIDGVHDLADHVIAVHRRRGSEVIAEMRG